MAAGKYFGRTYDAGLRRDVNAELSIPSGEFENWAELVISCAPFKGDRWTARVPSNYEALTYYPIYSGILGTPDEGKMLAVVEGAGYMIVAADPADVKKLPYETIAFALESVETRSVIMLDFSTQVTAIDVTGNVLWTNSYTSDSVDQMEWDGGQIMILGYISGSLCRVAIDAASGSVLSTERVPNSDVVGPSRASRKRL